MKNAHRFRLTTVVLALAAGSMISSSALADETDALARLEAARQAFESARAELIAAQEEAAQFNEIEAVDTSVPAAAQPEAEAAPIPDPTSWQEGWDFAAVVGLNGATGNNENFSGRVSIDGERKTSKYETTAGLSYVYGNSDGTVNTSHGEAFVNNDWLTDSKWRYFAQGKYEYDEFQAWNHRLSVAGGVGYELVSDDKQTLIARAGLGASYEFGGNGDEEIVPEGLLGLDWDYKFSENTIFKASTTVFPSFDDAGEFRMVNSAGVEVVMDKESGMTLNTGFEHRHDSMPGAGIKKNDLDYYMGLGWKF